ncbi:flagellar protein FlbD [Vallitalea longa]|uniref:Flagellar protein FlbD n=1 Tax=Vallitalea longa TaxID=2936439 RepID=A0A9W6DE13_9FIRM|nr:flagellar FlbD family protein [Vallitalea longa]GKX28980.1 flagellar protein FlbD [Vallitalea longa]
MIYVTKLNNDEIVINADLIEVIEETPNTIITLTTGKKIIVKDSTKEIIDKVITYKRKIGIIEVR